MNKTKIAVTQFELLKESDDGQLVSGFSFSFTKNIVGGIDTDANNKSCTINNCNGGNCVAGCQGIGSDS